MKQNHGVTLVALVITVIVLIILASVGISMITGEEGLIARARSTANQYEDAQQGEATVMNRIINEILHEQDTIIDNPGDNSGDNPSNPDEPEEDLNGTNQSKSDGTYDTIAKVNSPDTSKLNPNYFSYLTWIDSNGNNSNIVTPTLTSGAYKAPTKWYDYNIGQWANIKTVGGENLAAYWVWIPRFAYQVPNSSTAEKIEVKFIEGTGTTLAIPDGETTEAVYATDLVPSGLTKDLDAKYKKGGTEAKWIVHPAFTFGDNSSLSSDENKQLAGIWIAKFCASSSNPSASYGGSDVTNLKVMSVPSTADENITSWRDINIGNIWTVCQAMANDGAVVVKTNVAKTANLDTIPSSFIDIHPARNMEWGAAAILSQSNYGIFNRTSSTGYNSGENKSTTYEGKTGDNTLQVWNNSQNSYYVGYAGTGKDASSEGLNSSYVYNTENGIKASTTGTVYGVYDMAGCTYEYVMGFLGGVSRIPESYRPGITTRSRYFETYSDTTAATVGKIGDLTYETSGWNGDRNIFVEDGYPVFERAIRFGAATDSGVFAFDVREGNSHSDISFRPVLVAY